MEQIDGGVGISRRQMLALGGGVAGLLVTGDLMRPAAAHADGDGGGGGGHKDRKKGSGRPLPVDRMEQILQAKGKVTDGVLVIELDRIDIGTVMLRGTPIKPSFEVNGNLTFQPIGDNQAFFNGDLALKATEVDPFIDAILGNGLVFQAEHQHFYDFEPDVWFIHWRGTGAPEDLARRVHNVVKTTSTPLPQAPPSNPTTPLDPDRLKQILHGFDVDVGEDGVVTVSVARKDTVTIDGIRVLPATNVATPVSFEPLDKSGSHTAVVPDFGMTANEIMPVMQVMRARGWDIGCLYNQETAEQPQLYFSHQFKTGDPYQLAAEVRQGLDHMNVD